MITIHRAEKETTNTLSILEFEDRNGSKFETLFEAILSDLGIIVPNGGSIGEYLNTHPDIEECYKKHLSWSIFEYQEDRFASFVIGNEEMLEKAIVLIASYFGCISLWKSHTNWFWHRTRLQSFYHDMMDKMNGVTKSCIAAWFTVDDRGDGVDFDWGLCDELITKIDEDMDTLEEAKNVLTKNVHEAEWGDRTQIKIDTMGCTARKVGVITINDETQREAQRIWDRCVEQQKSENERNNPPSNVISSADRDDDLWRYPNDGDASIGAILTACNDFASGLNLNVRPSCQTWRNAEGVATANVITGMEFYKPADATSEEQVVLQVLPGQWLIRGIDIGDDGVVRDKLQVVVDGQEKRFIVQEYSEELGKR